MTSAGNSDAAVTNPYNLLPEEIWATIFDKLENVESIQNCCVASPYWRALLEPSRCVWLFSEVFPHLVNYLDGKEILTCRAASSRWSKTVDKYLARDQFLKPEVLDQKYRAYKIQPKVVTTDFSLWRGEGNPIEKFMLSMRDHGRNPFVGKSLRIRGSGNAEIQLLLEFLSVFGHFLHNLEVYLEFPMDDVDTVQALRVIWQISKCTPFLRRYGIFTCGIDNENCYVSRGPENSNGKRYIAENPFPEMNYLKHLDMGFRFRADDTTLHPLSLSACKDKLVRSTWFGHCSSLYLRTGYPVYSAMSSNIYRYNTEKKRWEDHENIRLIKYDSCWSFKKIFPL